MDHAVLPIPNPHQRINMKTLIFLRVMYQETIASRMITLQKIHVPMYNNTNFTYWRESHSIAGMPYELNRFRTPVKLVTESNIRATSTFEQRRSSFVSSMIYIVDNMS